MTFWTWLIYAILGVLTISFLPEKYAWIIIIMLLMVGIFTFESKKGLQGFIQTLEGNSTS